MWSINKKNWTLVPTTYSYYAVMHSKQTFSVYSKFNVLIIVFSHWRIYFEPRSEFFKSSIVWIRNGTRLEWKKNLWCLFISRPDFLFISNKYNRQVAYLFFMCSISWNEREAFSDRCWLDAGSQTFICLSVFQIWKLINICKSVIIL